MPTSLVVKKGSQIRSMMLCSMPLPVSRMLMETISLSDVVRSHFHQTGPLDGLVGVYQQVHAYLAQSGGVTEDRGKILLQVGNDFYLPDSPAGSGSAQEFPAAPHSVSTLTASPSDFLPKLSRWSMIPLQRYDSRMITSR